MAVELTSHKQLEIVNLLAGSQLLFLFRCNLLLFKQDELMVLL